MRCGEDEVFIQADYAEQLKHRPAVEQILRKHNCPINNIIGLKNEFPPKVQVRLFSIKKTSAVRIQNLGLGRGIGTWDDGSCGHAIPSLAVRIRSTPEGCNAFRREASTMFLHNLAVFRNLFNELDLLVGFVSDKEKDDYFQQVIEIYACDAIQEAILVMFKEEENIDPNVSEAEDHKAHGGVMQTNSISKDSKQSLSQQSTENRKQNGIRHLNESPTQSLGRYAHMIDFLCYCLLLDIVIFDFTSEW